MIVFMVIFKLWGLFPKNFRIITASHSICLLIPLILCWFVLILELAALEIACIHTSAVSFICRELDVNHGLLLTGCEFCLCNMIYMNMHSTLSFNVYMPVGQSYVCTIIGSSHSNHVTIQCHLAVCNVSKLYLPHRFRSI